MSTRLALLVLVGCADASGIEPYVPPQGPPPVVSHPADTPAPSNCPESPQDEEVLVTCSNFWHDGSAGNQRVYYAEHAYPGMSAEELARRISVVKTGGPALESELGPLVYTALPSVEVREGYVAVPCGRDHQIASSLSFVLIKHRP